MNWKGFAIGTMVGLAFLTIIRMCSGCSSPTNPALGDDEDTLFETISVEPLSTGSIEFETVSFEPSATVSVVEQFDTNSIVPLETASQGDTETIEEDTGEDTGEDTESVEEDTEEDMEEGCECDCHPHGKHKCHKRCHHSHGHHGKGH